METLGLPPGREGISVEDYWALRTGITTMAVYAFGEWLKGLSEQGRSAVGLNDVRVAESILSDEILSFIAEREGFNPVTGDPRETGDPEASP